MKISIVLSTYNGEKYIIKQMDSIRTQTRKPDEVLILDDQSLDNTVTKVEEYIKHYDLSSTWHLSVNDRNVGWRKNFMNGIMRAKGDLIFPCDQDDIWLSYKLERMEKLMKSNPRIQVLTSSWIEFYTNGKVKYPRKGDKRLERIGLGYDIINISYPGCTYCVRKEILVSAKKYWKPTYPHDAILFLLARFSGSLYTTTEPLIMWRKHKDSAYSIESLQSKGWIEKRKTFEQDKDFVLTLQRFVENEKIGNKYIQKILNKNLDWIILRSKFYDQKGIYKGLCLFKYIKCYPTFKQYLGDWYRVYINSQQKVG
ncbi:MAG: glycosyltransferase [Lactobacillus crispatus]